MRTSGGRRRGATADLPKSGEGRCLWVVLFRNAMFHGLETNKKRTKTTSGRCAVLLSATYHVPTVAVIGLLAHWVAVWQVQDQQG